MASAAVAATKNSRTAAAGGEKEPLGGEPERGREGDLGTLVTCRLRVAVPAFGGQLGRDLVLERGRKVIRRLVLIELCAMWLLAHRERRAVGQISP